MLLVHAEDESGVVDEHVDVLPFAFKGTDGRDDLVPVADVEGQDEGIGSQSGQLGLQGLSLLGLAAVDDDVIAACCELWQLMIMS